MRKKIVSVGNRCGQSIIF